MQPNQTICSSYHSELIFSSTDKSTKLKQKKKLILHSNFLFPLMPKNALIQTVMTKLKNDH